MKSTDLPSWVSESHLEYFPWEYQMIAEEIGFDAMIKIAKILQGSTTYFHIVNLSLAPIRNELMLEDYYSGKYTTLQLALKYGLTERWVYQIIKDSHGNRNKPTNGDNANDVQAVSRFNRRISAAN